MLLQGLDTVIVGVHNGFGDSTISTENIWKLDSANGGPTGFSIKNLSPTVTKLYGGDGTYITASAGTGDIDITFNALDLPEKLIATAMGYQKDAVSGAWLHGKDSRPVPASLVAISHDKTGQAVVMGLFKGTFTRGDVNPQTNNNQTQNSTDSLTFSAMQNAQGLAYAEGVEGTDDLTVDKFNTLIFGQAIDMGNGLPAPDAPASDAPNSDAPASDAPASDAPNSDAPVA
jgi:phi13 family phage major tail protein